MFLLDSAKSTSIAVRISPDHACRCGAWMAEDNPATNALNAQRRAQDLENLFVTDEPVWPASGGTNPDLKSAAIALSALDVTIQRRIRES